MRVRNPVHSLPISVAMLRLAALLVPGSQRAEWLSEWRGELWHVWKACNVEPDHAHHRRAEVTAFCAGAFQDAFCLRRDEASFASRRYFLPGSPSRCLLLQGAAAGVLLLAAFSLSGVHKVIGPSPYRDATDLVTIAPSHISGVPFPTVRLADYQSWSSNARHLFAELAFYQTIRRRVHIEEHLAPELSIARGSDNLLDMLKIRSGQPGAVPSEAPLKAILSVEVWREYFGGDPAVIGRRIEIGGQEAVIDGVIPASEWKLPGHIDLWLLENSRELASLPSHSEGFVLAQVVASAFPGQSGGQRQMTVFRGDRGSDVYDCVSLAEQSRQPFSIFLFAFFLGCLALPATTSLPLGEYPITRGKLPWTTRLRRWGFLAAKIAGILAIVYCGSLDLAYSYSSISPTAAQSIQFGSAFFGFLFAFRWALRDQRGRCPVCLRRLSNPAHVGQASQNFLAWNGMELVCLGGHGLLHVPDIPTSWFSTQRWLYLDPSWSGLFSADYLITAGTS